MLASFCRQGFGAILLAGCLLIKKMTEVSQWEMVVKGKRLAWESWGLKGEGDLLHGLEKTIYLSHNLECIRHLLFHCWLLNDCLL